MANIPSLPDLETDELSLFYQNESFSPENETGFFLEKSELSNPHQQETNADSFGSEFPTNNLPRNPEDEYNSAATDENMTNDLGLVKPQEELKTLDNMTVARLRHGDHSGLNSNYSDFVRLSSDVKVEETHSDSIDNLIPAIEELVIDADDSGTGNDAVDTYEDLSALYEVDEDGDTLLHRAIILQNHEFATAIIHIMVQAGLDLNHRNDLFQTPLHLAVLTNQIEVLELLLQQGADTTIRDRHGRTPIHIACEMSRPDVVTKLVTTRASNSWRRYETTLNIKNYDGESCVHIAAKSRDIVLMRCLVELGADINQADEKSGRTALHFAAENNDIEMVKFLLGNPQTNPVPETLNGETPVLLAYLRDFDDVVKVFNEFQGT